MNDLSISDVLVKATRVMLKEYRSIRFFSHYERSERRISSNIIINIFEGILNDIKDSHPNGEHIYCILYRSFFQAHKFRRSQLCEVIGNSIVGRSVTISTLYRWQQDSIKIFAYALWTNSQFNDISINLFTSQELKENYDDIIKERKKLLFV